MEVVFETLRGEPSERPHYSLQTPEGVREKEERPGALRAADSRRQTDPGPEEQEVKLRPEVQFGTSLLEGGKPSRVQTMQQIPLHSIRKLYI